MPARNILYAEDEPDDVLIFERAFRRASLPHSLKVVEDGQSALDWLTGSGAFSDRTAYPPPDMLILDLKMPRRNGFDVLQWVRQSKEFEKIPVIILSSSDDPRDVKQAETLGASSYFVKSASYQDVIQHLKTV